jgi:murein DD-endopeptidase MepM/ murein hydrolase activator NlpD
MPNIFGLDLSPLLDGIKTAVGGMVGESSAQPRDPFQGYQPQGTDPFAGLTYTGSSGSYQPQGHDPFAGWQGGGSDPFAGLSYGTMGSTFASNDPNQSFGVNPLFAAFDVAHQNKLGYQAGQEAQAKEAATATKAAGGGGPSAGMAPGVAKWADQTTKVFGDLGADMPDTMLAIMTNESGGDPNAYNAAGDAWGLFQNVGLGSKDPGVQFTAARTLAQQKLASIQQSYAANGLNPDERTRARDFALAWAGHFDYASGTLNPTSRDIGSNQTAEQLSAIFLKNYDAIKAGRQAKPQPGSGGMMASIWGGGNAPINQDYGVVDPSVDQSIYTYGAAYGLPQGHTGIDVGLARGTQLYSPVAGTVVTAGGTPYFRDENYGDGGTPGKGELKIRLDNGDEIILGHTSSIGVQAGQRINAGDFVGLSGSASGDHLHLEVRQKQPDGSYRLVAPQEYFGGR